MSNQWVVTDCFNGEAWGPYPSKEAAEQALRDHYTSLLRADGCSEQEIRDHINNEYHLDDFSIVQLSGPRTPDEREQARLQNQINEAQKQLQELKSKQGSGNVVG